MLYYNVGTGTGMAGQTMARFFFSSWLAQLGAIYAHLIRVLVSRLNSARLAVHSCDHVNSTWEPSGLKYLSCSVATCFKFDKSIS